MLRIKNSSDNDLIPVLIQNVDGQVGIELLLLFAETAQQAKDVIDLAEQCLVVADDLTQFRFTALNALSR